MAIILMICLFSIMSLTYTLDIYKLEVLTRTTCKQIYEKQKGYAIGTINFSAPIGGLACPANTYYHCLPDTDDESKFIQFCTDWMWIEKGKCPYYYSYQSTIQPYNCSKNDAGCPLQQYKSRDYYKYSECFKRLQSSGNAVGHVKDEVDGGDQSVNTSSIIIGSVAIIVTIGLVVVIVILFRQRKVRGHTLRKDEKMNNDEERMQMITQIKQGRGMEAAERILRSKQQVVIAGKPGSGKETLIRQLFEKFDDFEHSNPKYKGFHLESDVKYFIVITEHWLKDCGLEALENEMKKLHRESVHVIESSQTYVEKNEELKRKYEGDIVDLSSDEFKLNRQERRQIIDKFCDSSSITLTMFSEENRDEVCQYKPQHYGFFHLCKKLIKARKFDDPITYIQRIDAV